MHKLSSYLVSVDFFDNHKHRPQSLVFSTRTNRLKLFDQSFWHALQRGEIDQVLPSILQELVEDKIMVPEIENERLTILEENKRAIEASTDLYMSIQPTAACPLGCGYCGQRHENKNMKADIQDATLSRIRRKLGEKTYKSLSITWFGAEPLSGFPVIRRLSPKILEIVGEHNLHYHAKIVTNGLLLAPHIAEELIYQHDIRDFEITLDGIAPFHDKRRHTKAGGESFDKIYDHLLNLATHEAAKITIRCNVDGRNRDGVVPLLEKLHQDNLHKRVRFYVAPIHAWGNDAHMLAAQKTEFAQWELEWMLEMDQRGFSVGPLPKRNHAVCFTVHPDNELIDPFGGVFSCSEVSLVPTYEVNGKNRHSLGNVEEAPLSHPTSPWGNFYNEDTLKQYGCATCFLLPACGGACPKEWSEGRSPCPPTKLNIHQRLLFAYARKRQSEQNLEAA